MDINVTLIGQIITFAILVLFTMKFVWPPLNKMLEDREQKISSGLHAAEKGRKELEQAKEIVAEELKKVQKRALEIVSNAEKRAQEVEKQIIEKANQSAESIMFEAKEEIAREVSRAREELRNSVSNLVIEGATQILKEEVDLKRHQKLLSELEAKL